MPAFGDGRLTIDDVVAGAGDGKASLVVRLVDDKGVATPVERTLAVRVVSVNGSAHEGSDFISYKKVFYLHPGETAFPVEITLKGKPATERQFQVVIAPEFSPPLSPKTKAVVTIRPGAVAAPAVLTRTPRVDVPEPKGLRRASLFSEDFKSASWRGYGDDNAGKWQTRMEYSRDTGSIPTCFPVDDHLHPGARPFVQTPEGLDLNLTRLEGIENIPHAYRSRPFASALLTSAKIFTFKLYGGVFVESEIRLPRVGGVCSSLWFTGSPAWTWNTEFCELDAFEAPGIEPRLNKAKDPDFLLESTVHFRGSKGTRVAYGCPIFKTPSGLAGLDPYASFVRYGVYFGDDILVWYINDKPVCITRNRLARTYRNKGRESDIDYFLVLQNASVPAVFGDIDPGNPALPSAMTVRTVAAWRGGA